MKCPFCRNDMIAGATACGHCGAYATEQVGTLKVFMLLFGALVFGLILVVTIQSVIIGLVGFFIFMFVGAKFAKKKTKWYHRG